jgi:hypothetical protein
MRPLELTHIIRQCSSFSAPLFPLRSRKGHRIHTHRDFIPKRPMCLHIIHVPMSLQCSVRVFMFKNVVVRSQGLVVKGRCKCTFSSAQTLFDLYCTCLPPDRCRMRSRASSKSEVVLSRCNYILASLVCVVHSGKYLSPQSAFKNTTAHLDRIDCQRR